MLFKGISLRLKGYDYSKNGSYFVTINTLYKVECFGQVINHRMCLNQLGVCAYEYWKDIPKHFPFVQLDYFIIMPNHVHGIIIINNNNPVETQDFVSPQGCRLFSKYKNHFGPQSKNLGSIIRGYKAGVKTFATLNSIEFRWQSNTMTTLLEVKKH
jgi:putative transposase